MLQYNPIQAFTVAFISYVQLYRPCHKTAHMALQALFLLFVMFCRRCVAGTSGYIASLAPSWSVSHAPGRPIIIRYIRMQGCACYGSMLDSAADRRPCKPGGGLYTSHARRLAVWHRVSGQAGRSSALHPAGQSSGKDAAGGAEPLAATAASLFGLSPDS